MIVFQVPAGMPEHNMLAVEIGNYLKPHLTGELVVLYDTFCYISHEMLERLGHFKGGDPHEYMQKRLLEFGAAPSFIAETIAQRLKEGIMTSSYAPDVYVAFEADLDNRFRIPLWIGEVISKDTRDYDLYFKAYLYERLGVKEYFVFETGRRSGKLVRVYRLEAEGGAFAQYREIPVSSPTAHSEVLGVDLPVDWKV
ncbi:MAG: Uma2 family endonuclease [bacterium]